MNGGIINTSKVALIQNDVYSDATTDDLCTTDFTFSLQCIHNNN